MSPTATRQTSAALRPRRWRVLGMVLAGVVAAVVLAAVAPTFRVAAPVAKLTIDNPTAYQLNVEVSDGRGHGWLDLGAVGRERAKTVEEIVDQGARWAFRFSYGGVDAGQLVVTRAELAAAQWRIAIPDEAGVRLRAAGLAPSAS